MSDYLATRLSPHQLATLWGELIEAYHGVNGFGGNTAEIYPHAMDLARAIVAACRGVTAGELRQAEREKLKGVPR